MSRAKIFVISINNRLQYVLTSKEMSSTEKSMLHIPGRYVVIYYSLFEKRKVYLLSKEEDKRTRFIILLTPFLGIPLSYFFSYSKYNYVLLLLLTAMILLFVYKNRINVIGNSKE